MMQLVSLQNTQVKNFKLVLSLLFVSLVFASCGQKSAFESSVSSIESGATGGGNTGYEDPVSGDVEALYLSGNKASLSIDSASDVVLAIYSYQGGTSSQSFQISSAASSEASLSYLTTENSEEDAELSEDDFELTSEELTEEFHMALRGLESTLKEEPLADQKNNSRYLTRYATVGSQKNLKVLSSISGGSSYTTITAELRYQSTSFNFYVDTQDANRLTDDDLASLAANFQAMIPTILSTFGEWTDTDGNGRFNVVFTNAVNRLGGSSGGIVTGYFNALDLFDERDHAISNEGEYIYTFVPDPGADYGSPVSKSFALSNILPGVLPHELQHMINFNQHYFVRGSLSEQGWLNESLSHLAEDFTDLVENGVFDQQNDLVLTGFGMENPSRVSNYLADIANTCLTCGTTLTERGGGYLLVKYLYEQAELGNLGEFDSGIDLITDLVQTGDRGVDNVVNSIYGNGVDNEAFKEILGHFALALYYSNTGLAPDDRYSFFGIDLRGVVYDNRGTYLQGPAVQEVSSFPFIDSISGSGITYVKISKEQIAAAGGQFSVFFSGSGFGGYVIK
ncbi:MAG: hypothetical protein H7A33_08445 [Deltaproteobacteria bacterium]|nr:hypothetical protein [Deltaproteobacteria bacterium]